MNQNQTTNSHTFHKQPTNNKKIENSWMNKHNNGDVNAWKLFNTLTLIDMSFMWYIFLYLECNDGYLIFECNRKYFGKELFVQNSFIPGNIYPYRCIYIIFIQHTYKYTQNSQFQRSCWCFLWLVGNLFIFR